MDLTLSRLRLPPRGGCTTAKWCPDNEGFERLVSELAVAVAPPITHGAATLASSGFYFGLSTTLTPISASKLYWVRGTEGNGGAETTQNPSPEAMLLWNRFEARKGLPFGFELGASLGQGLSTSTWLLAAELKWAIFEGFHSGLGQLPDIAVSGVLQSTVGAKQLSLRTDTFNVTVSKPFVVARRYRITPFGALQALVVHAKTSRVDLSPDKDAWAACVPAPATSQTQADPLCSDAGDPADLSHDAAFTPVTQTRVRVFLGAEASKEWFTTALSLGFDATRPALRTNNPKDGEDGELARQISFQLSLGVRY